MWLGEPALILAISTAFLGVLFAIRRTLARAPAETSSDRIASDARDSRGIAGVIAPPPLVFLGFLALAAVLEGVIPPTTVFFPHVRYVAGTVLLIIGLIIGVAGVQGLRASGTNISTDLPATALVVDGIYRWSRNPLYLAMTLAYVGLAIAAGSVWAIMLLIPLLASFPGKSGTSSESLVMHTVRINRVCVDGSSTRTLQAWKLGWRDMERRCRHQRSENWR
jgi:protein-S-isoprenylcysteine O-methyltransferase Ste14